VLDRLCTTSYPHQAAAVQLPRERDSALDTCWDRTCTQHYQHEIPSPHSHNIRTLLHEWGEYKRNFTETSLLRWRVGGNQVRCSRRSCLSPPSGSSAQPSAGMEQAGRVANHSVMALHVRAVAVISCPSSCPIPAVCQSYGRAGAATWCANHKRDQAAIVGDFRQLL